MSLHNASKYLASKGRKGDTELVHMTKGEVRGLQQLALAHGGSLSINPETGLVEAGWLKTILPMVAGAALTVATGGTALAAYAPLMSAALAGGGMYAATGSLKDGLMAGLGAFGGANLAGGVMEAGLAGATEAGVSAAPGAATAPLDAVGQSTQAMGTMTEAGMPFAQQQAVFQGANPALNAAEAYSANTQNLSNLARAGVPFEQQAQVLQAAQNAPSVANVGSGAGGFGTQVPQPYSLASNFEQAGRGLPKIGEVIMNAPGKTALPLAIAGFSGSQDSGVQGFPPDGSSGSGSMNLASISPNFQATQPTPPSPAYQAQYTDYRKKQQGGMQAYTGYAEGGVIGMADGGMDPMSPMQNTIYPQSQQMNTAFATSPQMPNSMRSAMGADYDARTNPTTGAELPMGMASGGVAGYAGGHLASSASMPAGGIYRDSDPDTATKDAYQAALIRLQKINKAAGTKGLTLPKARMDQLGGSFDSVEEKASGGIARYEDGGAAAAAPSAPAGLAGLAAARSSLGMGPVGMGLGAAQAAMGSQAQINPMNNSAMMARLSALQGPAAGNNNPMLARLSALSNMRSPARAPVNYQSNYAAPVTPQASTNYSFRAPIDTAQSIAARQAAEAEAARVAAEQAAQNSDWGNPYSYAQGGIAHYNLGGYSDGGRMLKGPGDGMSDDIPASIGGRQPARLADGEFVVPADVVSHLGNGSTDAGAKKLYGMMDKVRHARTGTKKQGKQIKADKYLPK